MDVTGPFTLEDLDQFGSLDDLPFSLDDPVWNTLTVFDGSGSISTSSTSNAIGGPEINASMIVNTTVNTAMVHEIFFNAHSHLNVNVTAINTGERHGENWSTDTVTDGVWTDVQSVGGEWLRQ